MTAPMMNGFVPDLVGYRIKALPVNTTTAYAFVKEVEALANKARTLSLLPLCHRRRLRYPTVFAKEAQALTDDKARALSTLPSHRHRRKAVRARLESQKLPKRLKALSQGGGLLWFWLRH
ncbi:hypothetical protein AGMMS49990_00410 [Endomicrobiia bacterium]|nr:hypothetical protein AGMMS49990_00410 [Endomicrobiia bacterium]